MFKAPKSVSAAQMLTWVSGTASGGAASVWWQDGEFADGEAEEGVEKQLLCLREDVRCIYLVMWGKGVALPS